MQILTHTVMFWRRSAVISLGMVALAASMNARAQGAQGVSVAGLYSAAYNITVNGTKVLTSNYIVIGPDGKMTVYVSRAKAASGTPGDCYELSSGTAIDAALQGRTLQPGISPRGEPDYEVKLGDNIFGIYSQPSGNGNVRWFFHWGKQNRTATVIGPWDVVADGDQLFTITGPPLASPTGPQLQAMLCHG